MKNQQFKQTVDRLVAPQLEHVAGTIEIAGALNSVGIVVQPNGSNGLFIQSDNSQAEGIVEEVLRSEVGT